MTAFGGQFTYRTPAQRAADDARRVHASPQAAKRAAAERRRERKRLSLTPEQKSARRLEHAERLEQCRDWLATDAGMVDWLISRELNPDVSPLNQALAAMQAPREIVGTSAFWKRQGCRIRKGERSGVFLTAPGFWPRPAFTARQTDAPPELAEVEPLIPTVEIARQLAAEYRSAMETAGRKPALDRLLESLPAVIPTESAPASDATHGLTDDLPF